MFFAVITLFPEMFEAITAYGISGRAAKREQVQVTCINPRDFAEGNYKRVDERPFGGGPGMVMMAEPLAKSIQRAKALAHELRHRAHLGAVIKGHHHNAQEDHGRNGADPEVVHGLEAILHAISGHTDDFYRAQVGRDESQTGHPRGQPPAGEEEVDGARHSGLGGPADAQHEEEVDGYQEVVHPGGIEPQYGFSSLHG